MYFENNCLRSFKVYRKSILIYETYFKKYDFIRQCRNKRIDPSAYQDSIVNTYYEDGTLYQSKKIKKGRYVK